MLDRQWKRLPGIVLSCAVLATAAGPAMAEADYDRRLAEAATRIVADRMGPLRGSIGAGQPVRPAAATDADEPARWSATPAPQPGEWRNGMALAVEGRRKASPEL